MATDLDRLNLATAQDAVSRYRNLHFHRNAILEGIRQVAFRNMTHLSNTMNNLQHHGCADCDDSWVVRIQSQMLSDQGIEDNRLNRAMIGCATYYPLQVYLALLYAEIEFYEEFCKDSAVLSDDVLSDYLESRDDFVSNLAGFRNYFLHPSDKNSPAELHFLGVAGSYNHAPEMQKHIDDYMDRIRLKIINVLNDVARDLPDIQRLYCNLQFIGANYIRMWLHKDRRGKRHLFTQLENLSRQMSELSEADWSWSPNTKQRRVAGILARSLNEVSPSILEQQNTELTGCQTPMMFSLLHPLFAEEAPESYGMNRTAAHVSKNINSLRRMLVTAGVLLNESVTFQGAFKPARLRDLAQSMSREEFIAWSWNISSSKALQHREELASLGRVSTALLYEPLRLYASVAQADQHIARPRLRNLITEQRLRNLSMFRNSVFHVLDPSQDPVEVDLPALDLGLVVESADVLYGDLAKFFGFADLGD